MTQEQGPMTLQELIDYHKVLARSEPGGFHEQAAELLEAMDVSRVPRVPALKIAARYRRPDGTISIWMVVKSIPLATLADFNSIEYLEAAWERLEPVGNAPSSSLRLCPQLHIPTLQSIHSTDETTP